VLDSLAYQYFPESNANSKLWFEGEKETETLELARNRWSMNCNGSKIVAYE